MREERTQRTSLTFMMSFLPSSLTGLSLWFIRGIMVFCREDTYGRWGSRTGESNREWKKRKRKMKRKRKRTET